MTSIEPDDLYTLRAQYHLGHYALALEEAKTIARRPMSQELKAEREEYVQRAHLGLGEAVTGGDTPGM
jgi:coatomer subunit epsilon